MCSIFEDQTIGDLGSKGGFVWYFQWSQIPGFSGTSPEKIPWLGFGFLGDELNLKQFPIQDWNLFAEKNLTNSTSSLNLELSLSEIDIILIRLKSTNTLYLGPNEFQSFRVSSLMRKKLRFFSIKYQRCKLYPFLTRIFNPGLRYHSCVGGASIRPSASRKSH